MLPDLFSMKVGSSLIYNIISYLLPESYPHFRFSLFSNRCFDSQPITIFPRSGGMGGLLLIDIVLAVSGFTLFTSKYDIGFIVNLFLWLVRTIQQYICNTNVLAVGDGYGSQMTEPFLTSKELRQNESVKICGFKQETTDYNRYNLSDPQHLITRHFITRLFITATIHPATIHHATIHHMAILQK